MGQPEPRRSKSREVSRQRPAISKYYQSGAKEAAGTSPFVSARTPKSRRLSKYLVRFIDILLIVGLLFLLVRSMLVSSTPKVVVNDTYYHSLTNYQDSIKKYMRNINDHTKLTFNQDKLVSQLQGDYPEVRAASVELPIFSQQPIIRLQIAPPAFILKSSDQEFVIDAQGRAAGPKNNSPRIRNLQEIIDQTGFKMTQGKQSLSSDNVLFITDLISQLSKSKVPIKQMVLARSPSELDLYTTDESYYTKFYLAGDPATQIGQFLAARHDFAQKNIQPSQYLDVRVSGRIFYM